MRKTVLAAALLFGLIAPAAAQAPPPVPALPDSQRLSTYSLSASTCACSVGFQIYGSGSDVDEWIQVFVNGVAKLSTDPTYGWALTSVTGPIASIPRPITNAVLTFNAAQTASVVIVGAERPRRLSQFSENRGVAARDLNQVITDQVAVQREMWDKFSRTILGQPGDVFPLLPPAASRAGGILGFDNAGNPALVLAPAFATVGPPVTSTSVLAATAIPAGVSYMHVASMTGVVSNTGVSTCGLNFAKGTSSPTGIFGEVLNAPSGVYWEPIYSTSPVKACEFGAVGDGAYNFSTGAITGIDNTAFLQAAIDYTVRFGRNTVCISDGAYATSDTLQVGYDALNSTVVAPCGGGRASYLGLAGVTILPTKTDRCAINIQGGRQSGIRGLSFIGQNYVFNQTVSGAFPFPVTEAGWMNPTLIKTGVNPGGLQQHSPYAAICIDAYSGAAPTAPYPAVTYPSWTGIATQYSKSFSSDIELTNNIVAGFPVAVSLQPNSDGNGDFLRVNKFFCDFSTYCLSVPHTQSRGVEIQNVTANGIFTLLSTTRFGAQNGQLGGQILNVQTGNSYQLWDIGNLNISGPFIIQNMYAENTVRIGTFSGNGTFRNSLTFSGCKFDQNPMTNGVIPVALVEATGTFSTIEFNDCLITGGLRIDQLVHGAEAAVNIRGGAFNGALGAPALNSAAGYAGMQAAVNYSGSMLAGTSATFPRSSLQPRLQWFGTTQAAYMSSPTVLAAQNLAADADFQSFANRAPYNQATTGFVDSVGGIPNKRWSFSAGPTGDALDFSSGSFTSVPASITNTTGVCDVLTFTYLGSFQAIQRQSIHIGDILQFQPDGTVFAVVNVTGPDGSGNFPVTAIQTNNMGVNANGSCRSNNISSLTLVGSTLIIHTGAVIPQNVFFCDFLAGLTAGTNCQFGTGAATIMDTFVKPGDFFWTYSFADVGEQWPYPASGSLATVTNGSPGSVVLSAAATVSGRFPLLPLPVDGGFLPAVRQVLALSNGNVAVPQATTAFEVMSSSTTEANVQAICPVAGSFRRLFVQSSAPAAGQTLTNTLRVNNSDTALTCTITGTGTSCSDTNTAHTVACTAGQSYSLKTVTSATTGSLASVAGGVEFVHP